MDSLNLSLHVDAGRERECAEFLAARVGGSHWLILAALAAELVALHESKNRATVVVVAGADQAQRVLRDLQRDAPALPDVL